MATSEHVEKQEGNRSILENIRLWISSILAYCSQSNHGYPKILFVATHKDLIRADKLDERKNAIMDSIRSSINDDNIKSHLVLDEIFFVNARDKGDPEMDRLRHFLSNLVTENPQWGNKVPKQFILLEIMMASLVEEGKDVMTHREVEELNRQTGFEELSDEQLELFLHMQYTNGKLTYLNTKELKDHIIINPTIPINVLKSIVTAVPSAPELKKGRLNKSSLDALWMSDKFKRLQPYKTYFRDLLVYYDVLAEARRYDIKSGERKDTSVYFVPCMVTTLPDQSNISQLLQSQKALSFVFAFRSYDVPTALPNRLMASMLSIWNVKKYEKKEFMFQGFLAVSVDRKHALAIQVEQNFIAVYLIHEDRKELIIRDIASGVRECVEGNLVRISEVYSFTFNDEMKPRRFVPFDLKLRTRCCLQDAKGVITNEPTFKCPIHGQETPTSELNIWYTDRKCIECPNGCQGLPESVLSNLLNDTQILRLCNSLIEDEVYRLAIYLGLKHPKLDEVRSDQKMSSMFKFYSLRACRETNKKCSDFVKCMEEAEINVHIMCRIFRQEEVNTEFPDRILNATPTDEMVDKLSLRIGREWMILGLELGLEIECLEQIELAISGNLMVMEACRKMLYEWRNRGEVTTIRDLLYAVGRAGRNPDIIRDILDNCSSFRRVKSADDDNTSSFQRVKSADEDNTSSVQRVKSADEDNTSSVQRVKSTDEDNTSSIQRVKSADEDNTSCTKCVLL